tara:strand:+ start:625 stop:915 length:291 start_codon:yes stop_codon:yes gene_type:complete
MKPIKDLTPVFNRRLQWKICRYGVIIEDKILIAKSRSRWKKIGEYDWHSYWGLGNLCDALIENRLDEYALEQDLKNTRKVKAAPVNNSVTRGILFD